MCTGPAEQARHGRLKLSNALDATNAGHPRGAAKDACAAALRIPKVRHGRCQVCHIHASTLQ